MREKTRLALWAALTSAVVLAFVPVLSAQGPVTESQQVTSQAVDPDPEAVRQYWRANDGQNMREAQEMLLPLVTPMAKPSGPAAAASSGPLFLMGGTPGGRVKPSLRVTSSQSAAREMDAINAGVFPFSFTRYRLFPNTETMYKTYPYRTVGKLFFNIGKSRFVCSASVVTSFNYSVVWTAGHCVFSPGVGFHTSFLFVPAQRRVGITPVSPYGDWTAFTAAVLTLWTTGLLEYDHGVLVMNKDSGGQPIGERTGMLGFMANAPRLQHWHLEGYPQGPHSPPSVTPQFTGFHHEICAATWATDDQPTGTAGMDPPTIGVGCDLTGGSSGGPWVVDLNALAVSTSGGAPVAMNLLNGNNSYRYTGGPPNTQRLYGPFFSNGAIALRNFAENVDVP